MYREREEDLALVMESMYIDLEKCLRKYAAIPFPIKIGILLDVSYGLLHLHSQNPPIIHRDLTASNILLTPAMQAKIADLGVAKILDVLPSHLCSQSVCPGALAYMPPEALQANPMYDAKLDIFSFGVVMLYTINQEFPAVHEVTPSQADIRHGMFQISKRRQALDKMGNEHCLYGIVTQCLQDNPKRRYGTDEINKIMQSLNHQHPRQLHDVLEMHHELDKVQTMVLHVHAKQIDLHNVLGFKPFAIITHNNSVHSALYWSIYNMTYTLTCTVLQHLQRNDDDEKAQKHLIEMQRELVNCFKITKVLARQLSVYYVLSHIICLHNTLSTVTMACTQAPRFTTSYYQPQHLPTFMYTPDLAVKTKCVHNSVSSINLSTFFCIVD